jgi:hypothetical protein
MSSTIKLKAKIVTIAENGTLKLYASEKRRVYR